MLLGAYISLPFLIKDPKLSISRDLMRTLLIQWIAIDREGLLESGIVMMENLLAGDREISQTVNEYHCTYHRILGASLKQICLS